MTIVPVGGGVAMLSWGSLLLVGRLNPKGKPKALGAMLVLLGLTLALGGGLTLPFSRVIADGERFEIQEGLLGRGITSVVEMDQLQAIEVYQLKYSGRTRRRRIMATFHPRQGSPIHVRIDHVNGGWRFSESARTPALDHFLQLAKERGIRVSDRRDVPVD